MLVLCDGGSNSATMYLFKEDLQKLASRLGIEIRVAHYPPRATASLFPVFSGVFYNFYVLYILIVFISDD